jgi:hypothetical protein
MRTIATLQDPDSGSIELDGLNVLKQNASQKSTGLPASGIRRVSEDVGHRHAESSGNSQG